jgi:hypothetical protein
MRSLVLIMLCAVLLGCAVALGPGFNHSYRSVDVSATSIEPTHIHVSVTDKLENVGNRGLAYLDVTLPDGPPFGTRNVSVSVGGKAVTSFGVTRQSGPSLRVPFAPQWLEGQQREIAFGYDLDPAPENRGVVAATPDGFYLADPTVFPVWQLPVGPFAQASLRARTQQLEIDVPADFRVLAVGREKRSERRGDSVIYHFEMLGAEFPPYVIAGRYQERRTDTRRGTVVFWTRELLDEHVARVAAQRLAGAVATYQESFGPVSRNPLLIHIVETSAEVAPIIAETPNISAASFPGGVLFDRRAVALGLASDAVLDLADYELARTWFGWHVRPEAETDLLLGRGMALFAAVHAAEARGGSAARRHEMARLIATYERLGPMAEGKPGFGPTVGYNRTEQTAKAYKGALFLFALEDIAGEENFHRAVRRILADLAGQEIGGDELRSAVEAEAGRNLAGVFHAWFDHSGIPAEFRSQYAAAQ